MGFRVRSAFLLIFALLANYTFKLRASGVSASSKSRMLNLMEKSRSARDFCRTNPRLLLKSQRKLCFQNPEVTAVAIFGLKVALKECNRQFRYSRWDCSNLRSGQKTARDSPALTKGYKETSFAQALSAASVAHAVARACSLGQIVSCGVARDSPLQPDDNYSEDDGFNNRIRSESKKSRNENSNPNVNGKKKRESPNWKSTNGGVPKTENWSWGGCAQGALEYGLAFSAKFLASDAAKSRDLHSVVKRHNYAVGRLTLLESAKLKCKCHGVSGSCEMKTCWKSPTDLRHAGRKLRKKYYKARRVSLSNVAAAKGSRLNSEAVPRGPDPAPVKEKHLIYYESSPTFCDPIDEINWKGTQGRLCNASVTRSQPETRRRPNGCSSLCCGRGYDTVRRKKSRKCNCTFTWCCTVSCSTCNTVQWLTVCK